MAAGRPSKYKSEYAQDVVDHMREGRSFETFAAIVEVGIATLYRWCEDNEEFREAKNRGQALSMYWWEEHLRSNLITYEGIKFNTTGWIYTMKCRFPKYWGDKQEVSHVIADRREAKALTDDELDTLLAKSSEKEAV